MNDSILTQKRQENVKLVHDWFEGENKGKYEKNEKKESRY